MGGADSKTVSRQTSSTTSYNNSFNETFNNVFTLDNVGSQNVTFGSGDGNNVMMIIVIAAFVAIFAIFKR